MNQSITRRESDLTKRIMRRVRVIYAIRIAVHPTTLKVLIALVLFVRSTKYVSYANVVANMPSLADISAQYQFVRGAMFHTNPMTIVLLSSVAWLSVWALYDTFMRRRVEAWF